MDALEQKRIIDRIAEATIPALMAKLGDAYLRGDPVFLRYTPGGLEVEVVSAYNFYVSPDEASPSSPSPLPDATKG